MNAHHRENDINEPDPYSWTGSRNINVLDPDPDDFIVSEICRSLSRTMRYGGFSDIPVSVAQHICIGDFILRRCVSVPAGTWHLWHLRRAWWIHDAPEAYLGDDQRPLKKVSWMKPKCDLEDLYHDRMAKKWGISKTKSTKTIVKMVDNLTLAAEVAVAMPEVIGQWQSLPEPPPEAVRYTQLILTETMSQSESRLAARAKELEIA